MGASVIHPYRLIQHEEVKRHLLRMLDNPKDFGESGRKCVFRLTHTRSRPTFTIACLLQRPIVIRMIGAMIMRIVYGLDVYGPDEKYIQIAEKSMECFSAVFNPGRYLVQTLPWLRFVPASFPGAGFQREFAAWRPQVAAARDLPWEAATKKVSYVSCYPWDTTHLMNGAASSSLEKRLGNSPAVSFFNMQMERIENGEEDELTAKYAAAAAYLGKQTVSKVVLG